MERDLDPEPGGPRGERFESPFDVPRSAPPREGSAERLETLRCDPFAGEDPPREPGPARG